MDGFFLTVSKTVQKIKFADGFFETVWKKFIIDGLIKLSIKFQTVLTKPSENFHFQTVL
jgi:hypothetical protein